MNIKLSLLPVQVNVLKKIKLLLDLKILAKAKLAGANSKNNFSNNPNNNIKPSAASISARITVVIPGSRTY